MSDQMDKSGLRGQMRGLAENRSGTDILSVRLSARIRAWPVWEEARTVCAFCALPGEPDVLDPWPLDKQIALPRMEGDELMFHWVSSREGLVAGRFGVLEPEPDALPAGCDFDLILVPGMAFDPSGGRLGRGRGYYDRFLSRASGVVAGVCFDEQLIGEVPIDPHDIRMDVILTPSEIFPVARKNKM